MKKVISKEVKGQSWERDSEHQALQQAEEISRSLSDIGPEVEYNLAMLLMDGLHEDDISNLILQKLDKYMAEMPSGPELPTPDMRPSHDTREFDIPSDWNRNPSVR